MGASLSSSPSQLLQGRPPQQRGFTGSTPNPFGNCWFDQITWQETTRDFTISVCMCVVWVILGLGGKQTRERYSFLRSGLCSHDLFDFRRTILYSVLYSVLLRRSFLQTESCQTNSWRCVLLWITCLGTMMNIGLLVCWLEEQCCYSGKEPEALSFISICAVAST